MKETIEEMGVSDRVDFLNSILESSTEYSIVAQDLEGTILAWNEGAKRIYGYAASEVVGKAKSYILHHPDDVTSGFAKSILDKTSENGKWEGELRRARKDGSQFKAHVTLTLRKNTENKPIGFTMISRDITESERI